MNTDAPWPDLDEAEYRVRKIQAKLHQWATDSPDRRFCDLFNLVSDPAFLVVAWDRVRGNRGARTAGVDGVKPRSIVFGDALLARLREDLKARTFQPMPVRERQIPKSTGKIRRLGIATARDRVVQASLKLVLEPIFEADFHPCSYGFRPMRRAQDAIEEIRHFGRLSYEWILEGDIKSCFDEISHPALMDRVRKRVGDNGVLDLVKAFLKAGIVSEDGVQRDTTTGTPQGGILSPLLSNVALSVLDEHFAEVWRTTMATDLDRARRRRHGEPAHVPPGAIRGRFRAPRGATRPGGDERTPPSACRSRPPKLGAVRTWRRRRGREAAPTTTGRAGTARRPGPGKRDGKMQRK